MTRPTHTRGSGDGGKYVVEIDRAEEKGGIKKIRFRRREAALKLAQSLARKRKSRVRVLSPNGQEIYCCQ